MPTIVVGTGVTKNHGKNSEGQRLLSKFSLRYERVYLGDTKEKGGVGLL